VRRAQVLEAAKQRFRETGFHATTMAEIAASAGVSVGLLYRYFPSKEEIIRAIVEADLQAQLLAVERGLRDHPDDRTAALDAVIAGLVELATDRDRTRLMLEIFAETARSPALMALAVDIDRRAGDLLKARFGDGLPEDESEIRIRSMVGVMSGLGLEVFRNPSKRAIATRVAAETARQLLNPLGRP